MYSIKWQSVTVTNKGLIIKTLKRHQFIRTTCAETGSTAIAELLAKQISACELFQEEKRLDYKKKKKKSLTTAFLHEA